MRAYASRRRTKPRLASTSAGAVVAISSAVASANTNVARIGHVAEMIRRCAWDRTRSVSSWDSGRIALSLVSRLTKMFVASVTSSSAPRLLPSFNPTRAIHALLDAVFAATSRYQPLTSGRAVVRHVTVVAAVTASHAPATLTRCHSRRVTSLAAFSAVAGLAVKRALPASRSMESTTRYAGR